MADINLLPDQVINENYLKMNIFFGDGAGPHPCVIHIHGGSFLTGSLSQLQANHVTGLVEEGYTVISIQYRLLGEEATWGGETATQYPSQVNDVRNHIQVIRSWSSILNIDPNRIGVWGFSVGAQLAALVTRNGEYGDTSGNSSIQACVSVAPPTQYFSALTYPLPGKCSVGDGTAYDATFTLYNRWPSQWIGYDADMSEGLVNLSSTQTAPYFQNTLSANPGDFILSNPPKLNVIHGDSDCVIPIGMGEYLHNSWQSAGGQSTMTTVVGGEHNYTNSTALQQTWDFFKNNL